MEIVRQICMHRLVWTAKGIVMLYAKILVVMAVVVPVDPLVTGLFVNVDGMMVYSAVPDVIGKWRVQVDKMDMIVGDSVPGNVEQDVMITVVNVLEYVVVHVKENVQILVKVHV